MPLCSREQATRRPTWSLRAANRADGILIGPCRNAGMVETPKNKPRARLRATPATDETLRGPDTRPTRQSPLFCDPMPDRVEPCLATLAAKAPVGRQ